MIAGIFVGLLIGLLVGYVVGYKQAVDFANQRIEALNNYYNSVFNNYINVDANTKH